ncbi:hypothetical protein GMST_30100 [Geomonas silvestris]|uniref:Glycosyltransferase RgtA/B/C/D-like domain-containing protein n=1 Tax=Geomonas silvestris TaxID=2740184 RepID=A0A6V8MKW8_9BACT|nr:hypothetical protein GMST_30100 [Geomonas silvestris]
MSAPFYRPVNRLSYLVDYQLYGLKPLGYHAENILLHLAVVCCLYLLALRLFGAPTPAFAAALLFGIHPINAETVNLVSARNNLLAALFVFLSFFAFNRASRTGQKVFFLVSGVFFFLGLLCKETALMLLPFLFVYDFPTLGALRGRLWDRLVSTLPLIFFAGVYLVLRSGVLTGSSETSLDFDRLGHRMLQNLFVVPRYLENLLLPLRLSVDYQVPSELRTADWWLAPVWCLVVAGIVLLWRTGRPVTRGGLVWCAINLFPVANIIPIPSAPLADRFMYLPLLGLCLVVIDQGLRYSKRPRKLALGAGAILTIFLVTLTVRRNLDWVDDSSLFASAIKVAPNSTWGYYNLGVVLLDKQDLAGATQAFSAALRVDPLHSGSLFQLASIQINAQSYQEAERYLRLALQGDSGNVEALFNLAMLLEKLDRGREALPLYEAFLAKASAKYESLLPKVRSRIALLHKKYD